MGSSMVYFFEKLMIDFLQIRGFQLLLLAFSAISFFFSSMDFNSLYPLNIKKGVER